MSIFVEANLSVLPCNVSETNTSEFMVHALHRKASSWQEECWKPPFVGDIMLIVQFRETCSVSALGGQRHHNYTNSNSKCANSNFHWLPEFFWRKYSHIQKRKSSISTFMRSIILAFLYDEMTFRGGCLDTPVEWI